MIHTRTKESGQFEICSEIHMEVLQNKIPKYGASIEFRNCCRK